MKNIAVQKNLTPIKDYLSNKGYSVQEFEGSLENACKQFGNVDAIVVTGQEQNVLGIENISYEAPIIDANGMNPEEVERAISAKE